MKHNRYIPFGYVYGNGEIIVHNDEVEIINMIFSDYIGGLSYKTIAEKLTKLGVVYHETNPIWNKNMVKRILENEKYLGTDRYPKIMDENRFSKAAGTICSKRRRDYTDPMEKAIRKRVFCECGERYKRYTDTATISWWTCNIYGCTPRIKITDENLYPAIADVLNQVAANPSLLDVPIIKTETYKATVEVIRLNNEINRELEKSEPDEESLVGQILRCASEKYNACDVDKTPYTTETLKAEYDQATATDEPQAELIEKSVSSVIISHDGKIQIKFINGAIVSGFIKPPGQIKPRKEPGK